MELRIEYIPLSKLVRWPRNPKAHSDAITDSITEFGFVEPLILDESTGRLVAGHGRLEKLQKLKREEKEIPENIKEIDGEWAVPVVRGVSFEDEAAAEKFLLSVNMIPTAGGWNEADLLEMLKDVTPIGVEAVLGDINVDVESIGANSEEPIEKEEEKEMEPVEGDPNFLLEGVYRLEEEVHFFPQNDSFAKECAGEYDYNKKELLVGPNRFGIPNLRPDRLIEELPDNLKVWGGRKQTEDDGESWYLWNYGAVPEEGVPYARTILSFFTHDQFINPWWSQTSYHVAEFIKAGGSLAITPDCSIWNPAPAVLQMLSVYKANWIARWMQETTKIKIIPRLEFFVHDAKYFSLAGIPFEAPIVATQLHTKFMEEDVPRIQKNLEEATKLLKNKTLLVYVSERGRQLIEDTDLTCDVVMLETAKKHRAPKKKVVDEELQELRKRKKMNDPSWISKPDLS